MDYLLIDYLLMAFYFILFGMMLILSFMIFQARLYNLAIIIFIASLYIAGMAVFIYGEELDSAYHKGQADALNDKKYKEAVE